MTFLTEVAVGTHYIIRAGQEEEMKNVLFRVGHGVTQFTKLSAGTWRGNAENGVVGFGRSKMV